ncbi:TPA: hypothetical protein N0F65_000863 [Lagenidium giganteum]|uniref:Uncharacterized protein n=1 Tax=Lagenidium giganteum TaxID=4803 RepID=A0AAV2YJ13_9STRA|nr:TPA: hypothetical protein N0F65_000863 [Lagenidium giganteum]
MEHPATDEVEEIYLKAIQDVRLRRIALAQREDPWTMKLIKVMDRDVKELSRKDIQALLMYVLGLFDAVYFHPYKGDPTFDEPMRLVVPERVRNDVLAADHVELGAGAHLRKMFAKMRRRNHMAKNAKDKYNEGEWVWLYYSLVKPGLSKTLAHLCQVKEVVDGRDSRFFPTFHVPRLKPFTNRVVRPTEHVEAEERVDFDEALLPEDSSEVDNESGEYEVEALLDDKVE